MENFGVSQSAGTCGEAWQLGAEAGFCQDEVSTIVALPLWSQAQRPSSWQRWLLFFALDNFCLPAPEGLLMMTALLSHILGDLVRPVNEGTIKGSVVELGCGGKWG